MAERTTIYRDANGNIVRVDAPDTFANNVTFNGTLTATGLITANGGVSGTTGTFSGAVSGTTGTFSGAVTGSNLTIPLNPPRVSCTQNTHHDTSISGWTAVTWTETDDYDTDNMHSTSTNTGRFTANTAGLYITHFTLSWSSGTTNVRGVMIRKNSAGSSTGGTLVGEQLTNATASGTAMYVGGEVPLAVNDYLEFWCFQNSGGNLTTNVCIATARWVAP